MGFIVFFGLLIAHFLFLLIIHLIFKKLKENDLKKIGFTHYFYNVYNKKTYCKLIKSYNFSSEVESTEGIKLAISKNLLYKI